MVLISSISVDHLGQLLKLVLLFLIVEGEEV